MREFALKFMLLIAVLASLTSPMVADADPVSFPDHVQQCALKGRIGLGSSSAILMLSLGLNYVMRPHCPDTPSYPLLFSAAAGATMATFLYCVETFDGFRRRRLVSKIHELDSLLNTLQTEIADFRADLSGAKPWNWSWAHSPDAQDFWSQFSSSSRGKTWRTQFAAVTSDLRRKRSIIARLPKKVRAMIRKNQDLCDALLAASNTP